MTQEQFLKRYIFNPAKDILGKGSFGKVYKAYDDVEDRFVAIKVSEVDPNNEAVTLLKEVELIKKLPSNKYIAKYDQCFRFASPHGLYDYSILQYYPDGNLSQLINSKELSNTQKESISKGIIEGIGYLHDHNIVHRDLKSGNILIAKGYEGDYIPKIADFGLSKQFSQEEGSNFNNSLVGGTLSYAAPEQLKSNIQIKKNVDIWSLGVILYELWYGEVPFRPDRDAQDETSRQEIIHKINRGELPPGINKIPEPWQELIKRCIVVDNAARLHNISEVKVIIGLKNNAMSTIIDNNISKTKQQNKSKYLPYIIGALGLIIGIFGIRQCDNIPSNVEKAMTQEDISFNQNDSIESQALETISKSNESKKKQFDTFIQEGDKKLKTKDFDGAIIAYIYAKTTEYNESIAEAKIAKAKLMKLENKSILPNNYPQPTNTPAPINTNTIFVAPTQNNEVRKEIPLPIIQVPEGKKETPNASAGSSEEQQSAITAIQASMIRIPSGNFIMGCTIEQGSDCFPDEHSAYTVNIPSFLLSKFEVTQEQWQAIMGSNPSHFKGCDRCPVEKVSWEDAKSFISKLNSLSGKNYRLPSEKEWEYAARGGEEGTKFSGSDNIANVAWYNGNSAGKTHMVGLKQANGFGLFDMSGNVWEWCSDWYKGYPSSKGITDLTGANRVARGGSWFFIMRYCRVSGRNNFSSGFRTNNLGFRLAMSL